MKDDLKALAQNYARLKTEIAEDDKKISVAKTHLDNKILEMNRVTADLATTVGRNVRTKVVKLLSDDLLVIKWVDEKRTDIEIVKVE